MLTSKRAKFSLPRQVTYLNCAYMSPMLKSVEKEGLRSLRLKRNPAVLRGEDFFSVTEGLRREFSTLIGAGDPQKIAIIPSVSYGMAAVAKNLRLGRGQHLIVAAEQFPSNYYPWQRVAGDAGGEVRIIDPGRGFKDRGKNWNTRLLESINTNTRAVAIAHAHWADGTVFDLVAIRRRTREVGALLIVDGTQSVGALPFDVGSIRPDALVCAGYKWLLGPYSLGVAYYGDYFNDGVPVEENWINRANSDDFAALSRYEDAYQPGAGRYSMGEQSNFTLVPMLTRALVQLNRWGTEHIQAYCAAITAPAISQLRENGFLIEDSASRAAHLFGIRLPANYNPGYPLKEKLQKRNVHVSFRGDALRVSPHVYNDAQDMQKLASVLLAGVR